MKTIKMSEAETTGSKKNKPLSQDQLKISSSEKEFDPYDYGMEDGYGMWGAAVHIVRYTFGTGILLLPYTMKTVGYVNAIILQILVNIFYYYNLHTLISLEYRLCKLTQVKQITYTSLPEKTFENFSFPLNKVGALIRRVLLVYFTLNAYHSSYLLIFASSVQNLAEYFGCQLDTTHIITVVMVPILIFCMYKRLLKILVPFSATTNIVSIVITVVLVACCIIYRDPTATVRPFGNLNLIPQTVAVYVYTISCTPSILPVKNYMKQPQQMGSRCGAMNISVITLTFVFINFCIICCFCFGDNVEEDILLNLPKNSVISIFIFLIYGVVMLVSYMLVFSVFFDTVWSDIEGVISPGKFKVLLEIGIRIGLNAWAYFLAVGVSNFSLFTTIFGTLTFMLEVTLIPVLDLAFVFQSKKKCLWRISKHLVMIIICSGLSGMSLADCIKEVQKLYQEHGTN